MSERHFVIEESEPALFYGVENANLRMLRALMPRLRIMGRGDVLRVMGSEEDLATFEEVFHAMDAHCAQFNSLTEADVVSIVRHEKPASESADGVIVYSTGGRPITPRTEGQRQLVDAFGKGDMLFAIGPAGTGKTFLAIALAVRALKGKSVKRIVLCRPAVEAGEKLGFLPGDMKEKIDPYLQPLYDALQEMLPAQKLQELLASGVIQIAPLAFMRGRTLNDAVVILDEAQNTTSAQMKMFLTRMGWHSKMIITGDATQVDLPRSIPSGLLEAERLLHSIEGIHFVRLTDRDIVRHRLVSKVVDAYARASALPSSPSAEKSAPPAKNFRAFRKNFCPPRRSLRAICRSLRAFRVNPQGF